MLKAHLSEEGPNSWRGKCPSGVENSSYGDSLSKTQGPKPQVAQIVRDNCQTEIGYISNSTFTFCRRKDHQEKQSAQTPKGILRVVPAADISHV